MKIFFLYVLFPFLLSACQYDDDRNSAEVEDGVSVVATFGYDLEFLQNHLDEIITRKGQNEKSQLIIAPRYQGRVMTSTANGAEGRSYGWINDDLIKSGEVRAHKKA